MTNSESVLPDREMFYDEVKEMIVEMGGEKLAMLVQLENLK